MSEPKYERWRPKTIQPKKKSREATIEDEAQAIAEKHAQLKKDFLRREAKRRRKATNV